jgi:Fe-S-cluster-containing dehydrogenase component/formate-dependent nitrite reductase membrane component NrfD
MIEPSAPLAPVQWAKVIDHTRCIGCHACTTACKSENLVPLSVTRTYVKHVDVGVFPQARRAHQVTRCNQCAHAPCVTACPTEAMFKRRDGIVDFDKSICIGCKACMAACPYDAIFINPDDHSAEKCNFCAHRIDVGLEPACVVVCPTQAILVGDMNDGDSYVAQIVNREAVSVRRPEKETLPKLFYKGAHQATLDPLAARRPEGGLFMWSEQQEGWDLVVSGNPQYNNSSAAALLSYDVAHSIPWDWRVSLYTWTKGIAAGVYLVAAWMELSFLLSGQISISEYVQFVRNSTWLWATPMISGAFLAITGGLLLWDLEHPARFYLIFTRPQWRSWLVKGAFIITGYTAVLLFHFVASWVGWISPQLWLMIPGIPLAIMTAVYTAYLFAQAKARDMWQNPLLPPHLFFQAVLLGSAVLLLVEVFSKGIWQSDDLVGFIDTIRGQVYWLAWSLLVTSVIHLLMVWGEVSLTHPTSHARLAIWEMVKGRYKYPFWISVVFSSLGAVLPVFAAFNNWNESVLIAGAVTALVGMMFFEHAYVQAGQAVPLA